MEILEKYDEKISLKKGTSQHRSLNVILLYASN